MAEFQNDLISEKRKRSDFKLYIEKMKTLQFQKSKRSVFGLKMKMILFRLIYRKREKSKRSNFRILSSGRLYIKEEK